MRVSSVNSERLQILFCARSMQENNCYGPKVQTLSLLKNELLQFRSQDILDSPGEPTTTYRIHNVHESLATEEDHNLAV